MSNNTVMAKADRTIQAVTDGDQKAWDSLTHHPLQSWAWGQFRKNMGLDVVRLGVFDGKKLIDGWQLTFHRVPHTPWGVGYFPKGPTPTGEMVDTLRDLGKQKHAIFIQLEPNVLANNHKPLTTNSLIPSHHPLFTKYTFILDITRSEEDMLKAMHPKTRYNIRVAQKHGVEIREDNSPRAFSQYLRLTEETTSRQGFFAHNRQYHERMWEVLKRANIAHLFTATYKKEALAAWILFTWEKTIYYPYGASSRLHREVMAPNLMLWETMRWAKAHGYTSYDLWGALGPSQTGQPDPNDPWYGFHRFKEGFAPNLVAFAGSYDLVVNPLLYPLYTLADTLRWNILKLTKRGNVLTR